MERAKKQRASVDSLTLVGATAIYDYHGADSIKKRKETSSPIPSWIREQLGDDVFCNVNVIVFQRPSYWYTVEPILFNNPYVADNDLVHLKGLTHLKELSLIGADISDKGLRHLHPLQRLERINLSHTRITDKGLEHLKGLKGIREISISYTLVTPAGVAGLQDALPDCDIWCAPLSID